MSKYGAIAGWDTILISPIKAAQLLHKLHSQFPDEIDVENVQFSKHFKKDDWASHFPFGLSSIQNTDPQLTSLGHWKTNMNEWIMKLFSSTFIVDALPKLPTVISHNHLPNYSEKLTRLENILLDDSKDACVDNATDSAKKIEDVGFSADEARNMLNELVYQYIQFYLEMSYKQKNMLKIYGAQVFDNPQDLTDSYCRVTLASIFSILTMSIRFASGVKGTIWKKFIDSLKIFNDQERNYIKYKLQEALYVGANIQKCRKRRNKNKNYTYNRRRELMMKCHGIGPGPFAYAIIEILTSKNSDLSECIITSGFYQLYNYHSFIFGKVNFVNSMDPQEFHSKYELIKKKGENKKASSPKSKSKSKSKAMTPSTTVFGDDATQHNPEWRIFWNHYLNYLLKNVSNYKSKLASLS